LALLDAVTSVVRTAQRHNKSLNGANFYADKLAELHADAKTALARLARAATGDTVAIGKLIDRIFSAEIGMKERAQAARDLRHSIRTVWAEVPTDRSELEDAGVFPLATLTQTKRGYLIAVGRQVNGCYRAQWYDACAVMMRRLLESSIIEAFEANQIDSKIKDSNGDFFQLTALVGAATAESSWNLPRNVKRQLPNLRDLGHTSAHNRFYLAKQADIDKFAMAYRESVEAFLHLARLL
jgi:hypothetical protein